MTSTQHCSTSRDRTTMWHRAPRTAGTAGTTGWTRQAGTMWGRAR